MDDTGFTIPTDNIANAPSALGTAEGWARDRSYVQSDDGRLDRILDFVHDSLNKADSLEATLGGVLGDLMLFAYRQRQAIEEARDRAGNERLEHLDPATDQFLKITKQIITAAQLAHKMASSNPDPLLPDMTVAAQAEVPGSEESPV